MILGAPGVRIAQFFARFCEDFRTVSHLSSMFLSFGFALPRLKSRVRIPFPAPSDSNHHKTASIPKSFIIYRKRNKSGGALDKRKLDAEGPLGAAA
jgi:hypothetical protein